MEERLNVYMRKNRVYIIALLALSAGCGPQFMMPETKERPAQIVVSAYTQDGCF